MNYHLIIDHWLVNDFIETAEKISTGNNQYIMGSDPPFKHIKSSHVIVAPFGSEELNELISRISVNDRVYVHWFQESVTDVVNKLESNIPLYLFFWGGDFVGQTIEFFNFNHDKLTKKYLKCIDIPRIIIFFEEAPEVFDQIGSDDERQETKA